MSLNASSPLVEKVKYTVEYLSDLNASVDYTLDRVKLLQERLMPVLGSEVPSVQSNKKEADFPLGQEIAEITAKSQYSNNILDEIVARLRL